MNSIGQNLVPNPSFEYPDTCPTAYVGVENADGWFTILNSPDLFNRCRNGSLSIPNNLGGFQEPFLQSDNAYGGLIPLGLDNGGYREMMGIYIASPLEVGKRYYFSFHYSSGFRDSPASIVHCNCFASHFGMKMLTNFTDTLDLGRSLINDTAMLFSNVVFSDTSNWNLFTGEFIADSIYSFLILGNFFNTSNVISTCQDSSRSFPYVYIDNICLSIIKNQCFEQNDSTQSDEFLIYPSVGNGLIKIESKYLNEYIQYEIYNSIGKLIKTSIMEGGISEIDLQNYSKGVYFLRIKDSTFKIIII